MIKKFTAASTKTILVVSILLAVLFTMAGGLKDYLAEKSARSNGALVEMHFTDNDFHKGSMRSREPEKGWKATDGDPQLILEQQMAFSGIEFYMEYAVYPGEILLYYTTPTHPEYSNANMRTVPIKINAIVTVIAILLCNVKCLKIFLF